MKSLILALVLAFSATSFATTLECDLTDPTPGSARYLINFKSSFPGMKDQGIVLEKNMSTGHSSWILISGNATVMRAASTDVLSIEASDQDSAKPWTADEGCFRHFHGYTFKLLDKVNSITGKMMEFNGMAMNPLHKGPCPQLSPPRPIAPVDVTCSSY